MTKEIRVFTAPSCPYCEMAKNFLSEKGLPYKEVNVRSDLETRDEMIKISGQMGVPVIIVGKKVVVGFDRLRLEKLFN